MPSLRRRVPHFEAPLLHKVHWRRKKYPFGYLLHNGNGVGNDFGSGLGQRTGIPGVLGGVMAALRYLMGGCGHLFACRGYGDRLGDSILGIGSDLLGGDGKFVGRID